MEWFLGLAWEINHCKPGTMRGPAAFSTAVTSLHLCKDKYIQLHTKSRERGYSLTAGSRRVVLYQSGELPQLFLVHYTLEQGRIQHSSPGHIGTLLDFLARKWIFPGFMVFSWPSEARIGTRMLLLGKTLTNPQCHWGDIPREPWKSSCIYFQQDKWEFKKKNKNKKTKTNKN